MTASISFSFRNLLPQLSALAEKAHTWINRRLIHDAELRKWTQALNAEPRQDATLSLTDAHRVAHIFGEAFVGYGKPQSHSSMRHLGLNDLQSAVSLNLAWQRTLDVAQKNNAANLAVQRANATSIPFMEHISQSVASNTAQKLIQAFDTSTVGKASQSAELLLDASKAQLQTQHWIEPGVQQERLQIFRESHRLLESALALSSGAPNVEKHQREQLRESADVLDSLQASNNSVLTQGSTLDIAR